jgi:hypothetical protein
MEQTNKHIRDELIKGLKEMYEACQNPNKNEKCLDFENAKNIICKNEKVINLRQQIIWISERIDNN